MTDKQTIDAYTPRVATYANLDLGDYQRRGIAAFADGLSPGARVLDLGCGPGLHAVALMQAGFEVSALDATPAFVEEARARGIDARLGSFDDLTEVAAYDGIWASFSLLHAPRVDFPRHLASVARALRPGGRVYLGMKLGEGEHRDSLGRFYSYYSVPELTDALRVHDLHVTWQEQGAEPGLAGDVSPFVVMVADHA